MIKFRRSQKLFGWLLAAFLAAGLLPLAQTALAESPPPGGSGSVIDSIIEQNQTTSIGAGLTKGEGEVDIRITIARIIKALMTVLGTVAVILIVYAGFLWMTAGGNEEQITKAKKLILNATIGLIIILSAYAIAAFVIDNIYKASGTVDTESHFFW